MLKVCIDLRFVQNFTRGQRVSKMVFHEYLVNRHIYRNKIYSLKKILQKKFTNLYS